MSDAGYWIRQDLPCTWALRTELRSTQEAIERPMLDERLELKVLDLAEPGCTRAHRDFAHALPVALDRRSSEACGVSLAATQA